MCMQTNTDRYLFIFISGLVEERPLLAQLKELLTCLGCTAGHSQGLLPVGFLARLHSPTSEISSWVTGICQGKLRNNLSRFPFF